MTYIEQNLLKDEKIIFSTKLHPIVFLVPFLLISAGGYLHFTGYTSIALYVAIFSAVGSLINYLSTEFSLTSRRVMGKTGFIRRKSVDLLLGKVESIMVDQDLLGRFLNYGKVVVTGTGATKEVFANISNPMKLRSEVNSIL